MPSINPNPGLVSDFSNLPPLPGSSPFGSAYTLVGDRYETAPTLTSIYQVESEKMPAAFPLQSWYDQSGRYQAYWAWFNGDIINQTKQGDDGELMYRFPLRINPLRDIVRKNTSVLFGEAPDSPTPLVNAKVKARKKLTGDTPDDNSMKFATLCENIVNEVWLQSNGRALQQEAGELCQFLGGHAFQICYEPWRKDLSIPLTLRSWKADLFLPIWTNGNYWDLSEVYVVFRIESSVAKNTYGIDTNGAFVYYVEHWTRDTYSIYIDNKYISMKIDGVDVEFKDLQNPFGFVPFVYIPHLREGSFYGSSHVPDVQGLIEEYNSAMADLGDAIRESIERERYIRNAPQRTLVELPGKGRRAINLGQENPSAKNPPDVFTEDPPNLSAGLVGYPKMVYEQIRRSGFMPAVAEGEDEGSQRSGVTLDIRFWPATAHAKAERGYWETGLNVIASMILKICQTKKFFSDAGWSGSVPLNFMTNLEISQDWYPQIPRDRQSEVNEHLSRLAANAESLPHYLSAIGDVDNPEQEEALIKEFMEYKAKLQIPPDPTGGSGDPLQKSSFAKNNDAIDKAP